jgi:Flp pilus assembly CpaE family ATPase
LFLQTLAAADQVVLVAEPTPPSLRSLHMVLELLGRADQDRGSGEWPIHVVLNRADGKGQDLDLKKVQELLRVSRLHTIANDYQNVRAALNNGKVLRQAAPRSRALADVDKLARLLWSGDEAEGSAWKLLNPLAKVFGMF